MSDEQSNAASGSAGLGPMAASQRDLLLDCYGAMLRIRRAEERLCKLFADGEIPGFIHVSIGQESVPVGVSRHLRESDTVAATHRGHGQALAKGLDLNAFFAEMMGKQEGICHGRGGSMHIADFSIGMLGANGIVGGGLSIAVGSSLAQKLNGKRDIAVAYFGDGAMAEGVFHECLNLTSLWSLPCLFVCENNGWGEFSKSDTQFCGSLEKLAGAFNIDYRFADGLDVGAVTQTAGALIAGVRDQCRPAVLECRVERFHGHFEGDPQKYRDQEELKGLEQKDPIAILRRQLESAGVSAAELDQVYERIEAETDRAVEFARAGTAPCFADAERDVYAN